MIGGFVQTQVRVKNWFKRTLAKEILTRLGFEPWVEALTRLTHPGFEPLIRRLGSPINKAMNSLSHWRFQPQIAKATNRFGPR